LRRRIERAMKRIKTEIVIDFEKLHYATPKGIQALFSRKARSKKKGVEWRARLVNVGPALRQILAEIDAGSGSFEFADWKETHFPAQ